MTCTPFDLPKTITQNSGTVTLAYDGDQQRIRKTTPTAETLYFGDIYEQVTNVAPASTAQTYYVHSPERVVAVITQGGATPGAVYVHVDPLGSVDALTDANGAVVEHRSYDPFGQRRNPVWGQPLEVCAGWRGPRGRTDPAGPDRADRGGAHRGELGRRQRARRRSDDDRRRAA